MDDLGLAFAESRRPVTPLPPLANRLQMGTKDGEDRAVALVEVPVAGVPHEEEAADDLGR